MIRPPVVSGLFYPGREEELRNTVQHLLQTRQPAIGAFGVIAPHAGYAYSGGVAGEVFARVEVPPTVLLLGPNHQGMGQAFAVDEAEAWQTPLGVVPLATGLRERLLRQCPLLALDGQAHRQEHSLEVLLPFLQERQPALRILPISLGRGRLREWLELGRTLEAALRREAEPVLLVASTDMSHYIDVATAQVLDHLAIDRITALDPEGLYRTVAERRISMCGYAPVIVLLAAAMARGGLAAELVRYAHSGEASGDLDRVVGYAGIVIA